MPNDVEIIGGARFAATLRAAADDLRNLSEAHRKAGDLVASATRQRSRRRTGRLAASFRVTVTDDGPEIGSGLVYAGVQEYGWAAHNIRPSRALTGALADNTQAVADIYLAATEDAIGKVQGT